MQVRDDINELIRTLDDSGSGLAKESTIGRWVHLDDDASDVLPGLSKDLLNRVTGWHLHDLDHLKSVT
jgi:hypothetical protein